MIVDRVQCRHQLCTRTDSDVGADGDRRVIHEERVGVDKRVRAEPDVVSVAALKSRHDDGFICELTEKAGENLHTCGLVLCGCAVEGVELTPAVQAPLSQLRIIEIPLATFKSISLFPMDQLWQGFAQV